MNLPVAANDNFRGNAIRFIVEPRLLPPSKAARRLYLTLPQFNDKLDKLIASGFPAPCTITGNFDSHAIEAWQNKRSDLQSAQTSCPALNANDVVMQRMH